MEVTSKKPYQRFRYTDETLQEALELIRTKSITISEASRRFIIPKSTLSNKLTGKVPQVPKMGPDTVLLKEEEYRLEKWILSKALLGFPMHPDEVKDSVQKVLKEAKRKNPFTDDRPGKKWLQLFLGRHPTITRRNTEIISKARASVTEENIRNWFAELRDYLTEENHEEILENPHRIFNADETGFMTCPKTGKVLGPKNYKAFYEIASGPEKECITVLCTFSAAGVSVPPMVLYPYKRIPRDISNSVPDDWAIGRSDSGWMVSSTFYEFIANVFYPWILENHIQLPVLLFLDGHKSHINMELSKFCAEIGILLYCLLPNATHILQPCDVAIFKSLKDQWKKTVSKHKQKTNKSVTKSNFATLFKTTFDKAIRPEVIKEGFRVCGLFPYCPDNVDYTKCISKRRQELQKQVDTDMRLTDNTTIITSQDYRSALKVIETHIDPNVLNTSSDLRNKEQAKCDSLFEIWSLCKDKGQFTIIQDEGHQLERENSDNGDNMDIANMPIEINGMLYDPTHSIIDDSSRNDNNNPFTLSNIYQSNCDINNVNKSTENHQEAKIIIHSNIGWNADGNILINNGNEADIQKHRLGFVEMNNGDDKISKIDSQEIECNLEKNDDGSKNESLETIVHEIAVTDIDRSENEQSEKTSEIFKPKNGGKENEYNFEKKKDKSDKISLLEAGMDETHMTEKDRNENKQTENKFWIFQNNNEDSSDTNQSKDRGVEEETCKKKSLKEIWSKHLHWPEILPTSSKRKSSAPMPYAITSKKWKEQMEQKERAKMTPKTHKPKLDPKSKLKGKKDILDAKNNINTPSCSSTPSEIRGNSENELGPTSTESRNVGKKDLKTENIIVGSYVIVTYGGKLYPGIVEKIDGDEYEVKAMCQVEGNKNHFRWPNREDKIWYNKECVLESIPPLKFIRRGVFECPEIRKYI